MTDVIFEAGDESPQVVYLNNGDGSYTRIFNLIVTTGNTAIFEEGDESLSRKYIDNGNGSYTEYIALNPKQITTTLPIYANNTLAISGGLSAGMFYRTGANPDLVCVVH